MLHVSTAPYPAPHITRLQCGIWLMNSAHGCDTPFLPSTASAPSLSSAAVLQIPSWACPWLPTLLQCLDDPALLLCFKPHHVRVPWLPTLLQCLDDPALLPCFNFHHVRVPWLPTLLQCLDDPSVLSCFKPHHVRAPWLSAPAARAQDQAVAHASCTEHTTQHTAGALSLPNHAWGYI
eukprot:12966-Pelagomonas_calceolata.AAC.1